MIEESIKRFLLLRDGEYKFNNLVTFMEDSRINFMTRNLVSGFAIATLDGVVIDTNKMRNAPDWLLYFVFIHEIGHMKRINKLGKNWMIDIFSVEDYDMFLKGIFDEEVFIDRYASRIFYKLNKIIYPWDKTQQLNLPEKRKAYAPLVRPYFGNVNNDEATFRKIVSSFIK